MHSHKSRQLRAAKVERGLRADDGPLTQLQRTAGNAAVCKLMSSLHDRAPAESPEVLVVRAGTTAAQAPPGGMNAIQTNEAGSALGAAAGWTGIKMAGAFVSPNFTTTWIHPTKPGGDHFVTVDPPVASPDAVHDSFYPAAGDHKWGTGTVPGPGKKTYEAWHRVSDSMSAIIREGEQEHLDDAKRAYDLTYGLITTTIAGMAGQKFGPAKSPTEAEQLATDAFDAKLPAALSVKKPAYRAAWLQLLETLLKQSKLRDLRGWHDLQHAKPLTKGDRYIYPLEPTNTTNIRKPGDKSIEVVNYPDPTP
ncbi:hypothetical protein [Kribbella monticola]|uniref:hypothetical protein n=1 Tax=Kribbella monticola TaxID=2185285 RepID=UPI000DD2C251|nr:hypothetical protein [Kribbella monticola]